MNAPMSSLIPQQAPLQGSSQTPELDAMLTSHPVPTWRPLAWPVMIFLGLAFAWANFATLDEVASAPGEVVPQGKIKVIQHLEGGIIQKIYVTEGSVVHAGQPLVQLDLASGGANINELKVRLGNELLVKARLEGETQDHEPVFPPDLVKERPLQAEAERQAYGARKRQLEAAVGVLKELVKQRELDVQELEAKRRSTATNLKLAKERFAMSTSLLAEGLTPKMEHLQLDAEVQSLQGELQGLGPAIPRARAAVAEARQRVKEEETKFHREAQDELGKTEQNIARIQQLLNKANEQGVRAEIRSPINGIVKNMTTNTIGGVVKPGEPIMEIVPTGENLVIESKLRPTDRGYVSVGQDALVKISTYDFARYGGLQGKVILVAPDSSTDDKGNPFFRVVVQTEKNYLGAKPGDLPIMPGMVATVDVHTGKRTVMDYLMKPVLKLRHEAFRER